MAPSDPKAPKPGTWRSLPPEIRNAILYMIADEKPPGWTSLASVSGEWMSIIGSRNLRRLALTRRSLGPLGSTIICQQGFVEHIELQIKLPRCRCWMCSKMYLDCFAVKVDRTVTAVLSKLLAILATWKSPRGLTLELTCAARDDTSAWFENYYLSSQHDGDRDFPTVWDPHDDEHGRLSAAFLSWGYPTASPQGVRRLFESVMLWICPWMPPIDVVSRLVIRRQLRRNISLPFLGTLLEMLPRLESLVYEPWLVWDQTSRSSRNLEYEYFASHGYPKNLKALSIFENFDRDIRPHNPTSRLPTCLPWRATNPNVPGRSHVHALARRSLDLELLSLSYVVEADDFFQHCPPTWTWDKLESLALTSYLLQPAAAYHPLLCRAAAVALRMPKLRRLVIWTGLRQDSGAFIYLKTECCAHIIWRGTWHLDMSDSVVEAWAKVAADVHSAWMLTDSEILEGPFSDHTELINRLKLPFPIR